MGALGALESFFRVALYVFVGLATFLGILIVFLLVGIRRRLIQLNRKLATGVGSSELRYQDAAEENRSLHFECYLCERTIPSSQVVWLPSGSAVCRACFEKIDKAG